MFFGETRREKRPESQVGLIGAEVKGRKGYETLSFLGRVTDGAKKQTKDVSAYTKVAVFQPGTNVRSKTGAKNLR